MSTTTTMARVMTLSSSALAITTMGRRGVTRATVVRAGSGVDGSALSRKNALSWGLASSAAAAAAVSALRRPSHATPRGGLAPLSAVTPLVRASASNEWRGARDGGGKWKRPQRDAAPAADGEFTTAAARGGGRGKSSSSPSPSSRSSSRGGGRGRGGGGGSGGEFSPVKRRQRQFTSEQLEAIAALQTVADASIVPTCRLGRGKANIFLDGNPIVYGGAVETVTLDPVTGDPVIVVDHVGAVVGWGVFNADSMYRVRMLQMAWEVDVAEAPNGKKGVKCDVAAVVSARVAAAAALRTDLGIASVDTNVYRLVNSEGDRLSGVCVDVYGGVGGGSGATQKVAVASVSAAWVDLHRADVVKSLGEHASVDVVVWRIDEKMLALELGTKKRSGGGDGDDEAEDDEEQSTDEAAEAATGTGESSTSAAAETLCYDAKTGERCAAPAGLTSVTEGGVKYGVDLEKGHKTGFYVDQRDNRGAVRALARGKKKVMDVCCYTGGFALNAALGGAERVVGVDSSQPALDIAANNAELNGKGLRLMPRT